MRSFKFVGKMDKDLRRVIRRNRYDISLLDKAILILREDKPIPPEYEKHPLHGDYHNCWSLTLAPDWRLVYYINDDCVYLVRTGTHSDLY
jgi:mRNA interferase YafQ